jgi:hypothetical protein
VIAVIQLIGAFMNMAAFALLHFRFAPPSALRYLIPNLLGSLVLGTTALLDHQWGFLLLEGAWAVVAVHALISRLPWRGAVSRSMPLLLVKVAL